MIFVRDMHPVRFGCALVGSALVVIFGMPVVSAVLRGVAPYDLAGLTPSTLPERFAETAPLLLLALGLVAIGAAATVKRRWVWAGLAALLAVLLILAGVELNHGSTMIVSIARLVVMGGGAILVTVLVAMSGKPPAGRTGAAA